MCVTEDEDKLGKARLDCDRAQAPVLRCVLLEDHLEGAVVEGVSAHHPHDLFLHHDLVRGPGQGRAKGLDTGQDPEGLCGRDSQRAVWTCGKSAERGRQ